MGSPEGHTVRWFHTPSPMRFWVSHDSGKGLHCPYLIYDREGSGRMGLCFCTPNTCTIICSPQLSIVLSGQSLYCVNLWVLVRQGSSLISVTSQLRDPGLRT